MTKPYKGTVIRSIRISDELWTAAKTKAESEERSITEVIREALEKYVEEP